MMKALAIVCFLATVGSISAQAYPPSTCYVCNSATNPACGNPFNAANVTQTCQGTYCTRVSSTSNGVSTYVRGCSPSSFPNNGCTFQAAVGNGPSGMVCECESNYCNSAPSVIPKTLPSTIAVISVALLAKLAL